IRSHRVLSSRVHFLDKASRDLFFCAKFLFAKAKEGHSFLADQQINHSDSYQQGNKRTDAERNNRRPTSLDFFRSSAFMGRSDTQPEENFVHSGQRRHRRGFVEATLCLWWLR